MGFSEGMRMMTTILGLFPQAQKYPSVCSREIKLLRSVGFDEEHIHLISEEETVKCLLKGERPAVICKYAAICVFGMTLSYVLLGVCAGVCGLNPFAWGQVLATAVLSFGELILILLGIILGALIGEHVSENNVKIFVRGMRKGARVIQVDSSPADSGLARRILKHGGAQEVLEF
jgi:hypothetical protein